MFFNKFPYTDFHELNLDFVLKNYKQLLDSLTSIDGWIDTHEKEYNELKAQVEALENGNWSDQFIATLLSWYKDNIIDIIGDVIKTVHFGLTNDGYFCAMIPDSWSDISFDTVSDFDSPLYGHLMLLYD